MMESKERTELVGSFQPRFEQPGHSGLSENSKQGLRVVRIRAAVASGYLLLLELARQLKLDCEHPLLRLQHRERSLLEYRPQAGLSES